MANTLQLKNDIKKIKAALASKGLSATFKNKLKVKLQKAESDLKSAKPAATKSAKSTLAKLKEQVKKKGYGVYKNAGVDLEKDADEPAMRVGRRVSKGLKANQHGNKKDNKGNVYYEYRANRLDVKQPSKKAKYPRLADGGEVDKYLTQNEYKKVVQKLGERYGVNKDKTTHKEDLFEAYSEINEKDLETPFYTDGQMEEALINTFEKNGWVVEGGYMANRDKLKIGGDDFSFLLELSDAELSKRLDLVRKQQNINGEQYFAAFNKKESTQKIEDSRKKLDNQERAIIEARLRKYNEKHKMADGGKVIDADYWEDYYDGDRKINFMHPNVQIAEFVGSAVDDWEEENDDKLSKKDYETVLDLSYKFHQKKGWVSQSVVEAMIMQESTGEYKKGGKVKEPTVTRGFFEDEAYEYAKGGGVKSDYKLTFMNDDGEKKYIITEEYNKAAAFKRGRFLEKNPYFIAEGNYKVVSVEDLGMMADGGRVKVEEWSVSTENDTIYFDSKEDAYKFFNSLSDQEKKNSFVYKKTKWKELEKGGYMADGGVTAKEVVSSNAEMVLSQIKAVKHHADELSNVVTKKSDIEAWVVAKIQRASTDLSDITHYLEGQHQKMSMGGSVYNHLHKMDKK
jgi:hypothetical protein